MRREFLSTPEKSGIELLKSMLPEIKKGPYAEKEISCETLASRCGTDPEKIRQALILVSTSYSYKTELNKIDLFNDVEHFLKNGVALKVEKNPEISEESLDAIMAVMPTSKEARITAIKILKMNVPGILTNSNKLKKALQQLISSGKISTGKVFSVPDEIHNKRKPLTVYWKNENSN